MRKVKVSFVLLLISLVTQWQRVLAGEYINFDPSENGTLLENFLEYDLSEGALKFGPFEISEKTFNVVNLPKESSLLMTFPPFVLKPHEFSIVDRKGEVVFTSSIASKNLGYNRNKFLKILPKNTVWVRIPLDEDLLEDRSPRNQVESKLCLIEKAYDSQNHVKRLCTPMGLLKYSKKEWDFVIKGESPVQALLTLDGKKTDPKGFLHIESGAPIKVEALTSTGIEFSFFTEMADMKIIDGYVKNEQSAILIVKGPEIFEAQKKSSSQKTFLRSDIGWWDPTIGDWRPTWMVEVSKVLPAFWVRTDSGGLVAARINNANFAARELKIEAKRGSFQATYRDRYRVNLRSSMPEMQVKVMDSKSKLEKLKTEGGYRWTLMDPKVSEVNRYTLGLSHQAKTYTSYLDLVHYYGQEVGFIISGLLTAERKAFYTQELSYSLWSDTFLGNDADWAYQRFGLALRYIQSTRPLVILAEDESEITSSFKQIQAHLKYRLTPGLWGLDETWGLVGSFEQTSFLEMTAPLIGGGFFWGRSLPYFADGIFNIIPLLRYPKWVDMEFLYFPISLISKIKPTGNFVINFHGKVNWTPAIFGELGFGFKQLSYVDVTTNVAPAVGAFYLTMGLGFNF